MPGTISSATSSYGLVAESTTILASAIITGSSAPGIYGSAAQPWTVTNAGKINAREVGIELASGGTIINQAAGVISSEGGGARALVAVSLPTTISNAGTIFGYGGGGEGAVLYSGGIVTNFSGGTIDGSWSGVLLGAGGNIVNQAGGTILGGRDGILILGGSATIVNSGTISGSFGIDAAAPSYWSSYDLAPTHPALGPTTVVNAGAIKGSYYDSNAIDLSGGLANRVIVDPGATFFGYVRGGGALATLELASGASTGTLAGLGSNYTGFGTVAFDPSARWLVTGAPSAFSAPIEGFAQGDTLQLTGFTATSYSFVASRLTLSGYGVASSAHLTFYGLSSPSQLSVIKAAGGTEIVGLSSGTVISGPGIIADTLTSRYILTVSPTTIVASGAVLPAGGGTAIYGPAGTAWSLRNQGQAGDVTLASGGTVINDASAMLGGVSIAGAPGTITNAGHLTGTNIAAVLGAGGTIVNSAGGTVASGNPASDAIVIGGGTGDVVNNGIILGMAGVALGTGTVSNSGTIAGTGTAVAAATYLHLTNSGSIAGTSSGVSATSGTISNNAGGRIVATGGTAIGFTSFASVANLSGALVSASGTDSVGISFAAGTGLLDNAGTIQGATGVDFQAPAGGTTSAAAGTLIDSGTIDGTGGVAVSFAPNVANRLIAEPGAAFSGTVLGGGTLSTLELGPGQTPGALYGVGSQLLDFGTVTIDPTALWTLGVDPAALPGQIDGLTFGDTLQLQGFTALGSAFSGGVLTLTGTGVTNTVTLDLQTGTQLSDFTVTDKAGNTNIALTPVPGVFTGHAGSTFDLSVIPTTIMQSGTISAGGSEAVYGSSANTWQLTNAGVISGTFAAIKLRAGGTIVNLPTGKISASAGGAVGIETYAEPSSITNAGTIDSYGGGSAGVYLYGGGGVTNLSGGLLTSSWTGIKLGASGSVDNQAHGTIAGTWYGVILTDGALSIVNSGVIQGIYGVDVAAASNWLANSTKASYPVFGASTVVNAGTIIASRGDAVTLASSLANRVVVDPGAVFVGTVNGGGTLATLELASGASAGVINGVGSQFTHFGTMVFDSGASWLVTESASAPQMQDVGLAPGDTIELTGFIASGSTFSNGQLTITSTGAVKTVTLDLPGLSSGTLPLVTAVGSATEITAVPVCFRIGTRIATPSGERPVEDLRPGDEVLTVSGRARAIVWIGRRKIDLARHPRAAKAAPVRVRQDALGPELPKRDLFLSPNHALYLDGALIPVHCLIDGDAIAQEPATGVVEYLHVELATHDVILAEGLAAETYLDVGDRATFGNGGAVVSLHPDLAGLRWETEGYAPLVITGPHLERVRARLATLAGAGRRAA